MYRLGVKNCFGSSPICSEGKKNSFYIILNFFKPCNPTEHIFQLEVCIADF